jgi:hypothetical protein
MWAGPHGAARGEAAPWAGPHRETPPGQPRPDKGRGPSTHEMEGPIRSSSAGHSYLMLSVRTTRSTTKPETRLKSQLPSSPCVRGAPRMVPFSAVRDFYAYLGLPHKRFWPAISRFFGRPPIVHSSAQVIPQLTRFLHMKSTGEPHTRFLAGCFAARRTPRGGGSRRSVWVSPSAKPGQPNAKPAQPDAGQRLPQPDAPAGCRIWAPQCRNRRAAGANGGWANGGRANGGRAGRGRGWRRRGWRRRG